MPITRASVMTAVSRGFAARCPACGRGRIFRRGVESEPACGVCGWRLDRCPGHWIGGNEINLLATFPAGILAFALSALAFGPGPISVTVAVVASGAFSVAFYRPSRGLFFALDYLIDSAPDASPSRTPPPHSPDDGPDFRGDVRDRPWPDHRCGAAPAATPARSPARSTEPRGRSSESSAPRRAPPCPPPSTVSP